MAKVSSINSKKKMCPYCSLVPSDTHPEYSCPRIETIEVTSEGIVAHFVSPKKWERLKKELDLNVQKETPSS